MKAKPKAFISYSHKDINFKNNLLKHLESINKLFNIDFWHDGKIDAGGHITDEIIEALDTSDIILLLITNEYIASNFCYNIEMERAFEREKQNECIIVPILLKKTSLNEGMPFYDLKTLPTDRKPITSFRPYNDGYVDVTEQLTKLIESFVDNKASTYKKRIIKSAPKISSAEFKTDNQLSIYIAQDGKISPYPLNQELISLITKTNENITELISKFNELVIKHSEKYRDKLNKSKLKKINQKQQRKMLQLLLLDLFIEIKSWIFANNTDVRIHARGLIENKYNCIFALSEENSSKTSRKCYEIDWTKELKEMSLNSMIHTSGVLGVPMVKSLNPRQHEKGNNDNIWVDYLTCSFKNVYRSPEPLLSFGISIRKSSKRRYKNLLIALAYLRIDKWVENTINQYIKMCHDVDNTYDIKEIINSFVA